MQPAEDPMIVPNEMLDGKSPHLYEPKAGQQPVYVDSQGSRVRP